MTVSPAMIGEEGEEVTDMASSAWRQLSMETNYVH